MNETRFSRVKAIAVFASLLGICGLTRPLVAQTNLPFADPQQSMERTCFQTHVAWKPDCDLRADVAIVYGFDANVEERVKSWRDRGYRVHLMTGVAWGNYTNFLFGGFDGKDHNDERQTDRSGRAHGHGGGAYYMSPSTNYGNYLSAGVRKALDAGVEAVHLEEPEFWVQNGYSDGFKREWQSYYGEPWQAPHSSVDAQWRASNLKYYLYRRALQQVFDSILAFNKEKGAHVRCYVPTHSLINYADWGIVSPESSLARLNGCDGYIAQVWTGTSRTPNFYHGQERERTFDTAFLEYGAMQNLVRSTGRTVWYLNDPIEDNGNHDWNDYQQNWECTLTASLFQPEVSRYEIAPWPERIFNTRYPRNGPREDRKKMPPAYATELQVIWNALDDMAQTNVSWNCGATGLGVIIGDSLMFERGDPSPSDSRLGGVYGLALPFLKRGLPVQPIQLEDAQIPGYLDGVHCLLMSYHGMKPLTPEVHAGLADWVKRGGLLVFCDDDGDPFDRVREWWNTNGMHYATPRQHLFEQLGVAQNETGPVKVGQGELIWLHHNPAVLSRKERGDEAVVDAVRRGASDLASSIAPHFAWSETNCLYLKRGPYIVAAGLDESIAGEPRVLKGRFINLFDSELKVQREVVLSPGHRFVLLDVDAPDIAGRSLLAAGCRAVPQTQSAEKISALVEGVGGTAAVVLIRAPRAAKSVTLAGANVESVNYSADEGLMWIHFLNEAAARELTVLF